MVKKKKGLNIKIIITGAEPVKSAPSHRVLAMRRGENEDVLKLEILPPEDGAITLLEKQFLKARNAKPARFNWLFRMAINVCLRRQCLPNYVLFLKEKADEEAIRVFAENARQLLLAAPMGQKNVLAIDPGFRTGCKVVCLDKQGKLLENTTIYPHTGQGNVKNAAEIIKSYVQNML